MIEDLKETNKIKNSLEKDEEEKKKAKIAIIQSYIDQKLISEENGKKLIDKIRELKFEENLINQAIKFIMQERLDAIFKIKDEDMSDEDRRKMIFIYNKIIEVGSSLK